MMAKIRHRGCPVGLAGSAGLGVHTRKERLNQQMAQNCRDGSVRTVRTGVPNGIYMLAPHFCSVSLGFET